MMELIISNRVAAYVMIEQEKPMLVRKSKQRSWSGASAPKFQRRFRGGRSTGLCYDMGIFSRLKQEGHFLQTYLIRKAAWPRSENIYDFHGNHMMVTGNRFMSASYDVVDHQEAPCQSGNINSLSNSVPHSDPPICQEM